MSRMTFCPRIRKIDFAIRSTGMISIIRLHSFFRFHYQMIPQIMPQVRQTALITGPVKKSSLHLQKTKPHLST